MAASTIPRLTIAGREVPARGYGPHSWFRPFGIEAPEIIWCLPVDIAEEVLDLQETEITMAVAGQVTPKTIKRVKVVKESRSDDPLKRYVVLSDARWYWPRIYVKCDYNLRIQSGETELLKVDGSPLEVDPVNYRTTYASSSLKGGKTPWTADEILDDVFQHFLKVTTKRLSRSLGGYAPNDVHLDGPGNVSLAHALAEAGGLDVRINDDGDPELVDAFLGSEKETIEKFIPYSLLRRGVMRWISMSNVAPKSVSNGFDAELEVRADGWLRAPGTGLVDVGSYPTLDMVIQVTDKQLATTDPVSGKSYQAVCGSYLPADQWFDAVAGDAVVPAPAPIPPQVSWSRAYECIDFFRGFMEFWYVTGQTGGLEASAAWSGRFRSMKENFLKTWRLNPAFSSLCVPGTIRPVRAQLLDAANQTRQPSPVYQDYCRRPSVRGVRDEKNFGWNIHAIPGTPLTQKVGATKAYDDPDFPAQVVKLENCLQAPVSVGLADPVAGIFRFGFKKDVFDHSAELVPALVQQLPTNDLDQVNRGAGLAYWEQSQIVTTHRVILVFTAVPAAAPLYFVDASFEEAIARLGVTTTTTPKGPVFQTRTGPALQTARIAYSDKYRAATQAIFAPGDATTARALLHAFQPVNFSILKDYTISVGATLYAAMLDHYEGEQDIAFSPDAMPIGSLKHVTHTFHEDGSVFTTFVAKHSIPPVQPIHVLERGARAAIFRSPSNYQ